MHHTNTQHVAEDATIPGVLSASREVMARVSWNYFCIGRHPGKTSKRMRCSALLTCADYGILDFSLIISPSTANLPYP